MKKFRFLNKTFAIALIAVMAIISVASAQGGSHELAVAQQNAVVGATACQFGAGVAVGLGVAGLFGCVVCGVGSLVIGAVELFAC